MQHFGGQFLCDYTYRQYTSGEGLGVQNETLINTVAGGITP